MWESMMGKSITPNASFLQTLSLRGLPSADPLERGHFDREFFQSRAHTLQRRSLRGFDAVEILERLLDARMRDDDDAVAVADHDIARGDRHAPANDRKADRARSAPLRRIRRDPHGESWNADLFEVLEIAHQAVGNEARDAAVARDIHQEISGHGGSGIAIGCNHEHIARLAFSERRHEREIIERPAVAGERDADERLAHKPLDPPVERARAVHGVDDEGGRRAEALDDISRWAFDG